MTCLKPRYCLSTLPRGLSSRLPSIPLPILCGYTSTVHKTRLRASPPDGRNQPARFSFGLPDLIVAGEWPLRWVAHHTGTHHIGIDVHHTSCWMIAAFHSCRMITILPVGSFSALSLIVFLPGSAGHQLH